MISKTNRQFTVKAVILILTLIFLIPGKGRPQDKDALILASIPWQKTPILEEIYQPLIQLLQERLNTHVKFYVTRDYMELANRLDTGAADLGIFGGNSYVEAREKFPGIRYLATCMQPTDHYNSLIVVLNSSGIHDILDLAGKSFAFTDRSSTSGYIYPLLMMTQKGLNPETDCSITYFLEKHDKVYDAVAKGVIDAGGVSSTALEEAIKRNGDVFSIIATSDPIPRNAVVAGPHLSEERLFRIIDVLASAAGSPEFKNSPSILRGFTIKSDSFYAIVREARKIKE
ncbi:MAG: phosphate/phosphite/phosphonate ABC transporter substrate-binding protein [Pseudomonadota bacterium]